MPLPRHLLSWRSWRFRTAFALLLATLILRLLWGAYARHKLQAQLEDLRRQGLPIVPKEVIFEHVPDSQNAWPVLLQAASASQSGVDSPRASNDTYRDSPPYPPSWLKRARDSEKANAQAFVISRKLRGYSRIQFHDRLSSPVYTAVYSYNGVRNLANTVTDGALYAQSQGTDVEAIERIRDVLHQGRLIHQDPLLVAQLVALGVDALACSTAEIIAPGLRLSDNTARQHARGLITDLLDEEASWRGFASCFPIERLAMTDYLTTRAKGYWALQPLAELEKVRSDHFYAIAFQAAHQRNRVQALRILSQADRDEPIRFTLNGFSFVPQGPSVPRYSRWFTGASAGIDRSFEVQFRFIAERRAAAISLAIQLYRADHDHRPARLEELVPQYLPALPADPFYGDNRPFGYVIQPQGLPDGSGRPMITFDAGPDDPSAIGAEPMYSFQRGANGQVFRQYRDLSRFEPPSPKAVDGDPGQSDAPGDSAEKKDPPGNP
jgi:hypothetical protein